MADKMHYPIDVVALWGPEEETGLGAAPPLVPALDLRPGDVRRTNSNGGSASPETPTSDDIRLAEAMAGNHSDVVRRSDLDAVCAQLERALSQQLAVALHDLMAAWAARLPPTGDHLLEIAEDVRSEVKTLRDQLTVVDGLPSFQREIRHEVARLDDLVTASRFETADRDDLAATVDLLRAELAELRTEISELLAATDSRDRGLSVYDR